MLTTELLRPSQYRQVAEWEFGPQPDDTDWERYITEMNAPQWAHFALYSHADFIGCISLEKIDRQMIAYHVVTARREVGSHALAQVLLKMAGEWFALGYMAMVARIPHDKRAAAVLAIRCHMKEWGHDALLRYFMLTKSRFERLRS